MILFWLFLRAARRLLQGAFAFSVLLVALYQGCCVRIDSLDHVQDAARLVVVGRVIDNDDNTVGNAVYQVSDLTGSVWCMTERGAPQVGTYVVVIGTKESTRTRRAVCVEWLRVSGF